MNLTRQHIEDVKALTDFLLTGETRRCQGDTSSTTTTCPEGRGLPQQAPPTSANDNEAQP